jgi:uncharacterized membrane protein
MPRKKSGFFYRLGDFILSPKRPRWRVRRPKVKPKERKQIPRLLRGYLERRHAGWPEYLMLKVQLGIAVLFIAVVLHLLLFPTHQLIFLPLLLCVSGYLVYLAFGQLRSAFGSDYPAYRAFVLMCLGIAWIFLLALRYSPIPLTLEPIQLALLPPVLAIASVFVLFSVFRLRYGRNFTYGTVEAASGHQALVRVGYDICSNVKAGLYPVESFTRLKPGDLVKLSVDRPLLGLRGSKVRAVLEKVREARCKPGGGLTR